MIHFKYCPFSLSSLKMQECTKHFEVVFGPSAVECLRRFQTIEVWKLSVTAGLLRTKRKYMYQTHLQEQNYRLLLRMLLFKVEHIRYPALK